MRNSFRISAFVTVLGIVFGACSGWSLAVDCEDGCFYSTCIRAADGSTGCQVFDDATCLSRISRPAHNGASLLSMGTLQPGAIPMVERWHASCTRECISATKPLKAYDCDAMGVDSVFVECKSCSKMDS